MLNSFFDHSLDPQAIRERVLEVESGKVGFYSVGLYPASLAYNCAMQNEAGRLMLAARPGRELLGAFDDETLASMDRGHVETVLDMGSHLVDGKRVANALADLILNCELVLHGLTGVQQGGHLRNASLLGIHLQIVKGHLFLQFY